MEQAPAFGVIEDVSVGTSAYLRERWGWKFYAPFVILIAVGLLVLLWLRVFHGFFLALLWYVIGYALAHRFVQVEFMRQFAAKNGFTHELVTPRPEHGHLFDRGDGRAAWNGVVGARAGLPLRFFLYSYTTGSGKSRTTHNFTVAEVTFRGSVPEVIVDARGDIYFDGAGGTHRTLETGTEFDTHFILRVAEDHEIEALEVFTPEVMEEILKRGKGCSFEFVADRLYVWKQGHANTSEDLRRMFDLASYLIDTLGYRLGRLHDDVAAIKSLEASKR